MSLNPLDDTQLSVLQIVQTLLQGQDKSTITAGILRQHIDMVCQMKPEWSRLDNREILVEELIRRYSIWMGEDTSLSNDEGHQPWLTADAKREWRYWHRYRQWLGKTMPWGSWIPLTVQRIVFWDYLSSQGGKDAGTGVVWWSAMFSRGKPATIPV